MMHNTIAHRRLITTTTATQHMAGESNAVVFHEGRRYRRADCKDGSVRNIGRQSRTQRGRHSTDNLTPDHISLYITGCIVSQQPIQPHPPPYDLRARGILPVGLCPSLNLAHDQEPSPSPSPFQVLQVCNGTLYTPLCTHAALQASATYWISS